MPLFTSKLELTSAASGSGTALADVDFIRGAFRTVADTGTMNGIPASQVATGQIIWNEGESSTYQATITPADYVNTFEDTVSWTVFTGFGAGGGGGSGDITAVFAGNGLDGSSESGDVTLSINTGAGINILSDAVALNTGSTHFIDAVQNLSGFSIFQPSGSIFSANTDLEITGSLTIDFNDSTRGFSITSSSLELFSIHENGVLQLISQSVTPTPLVGGLYIDQNNNLFIGG